MHFIMSKVFDERRDALINANSQVQYLVSDEPKADLVEVVLRQLRNARTETNVLVLDYLETILEIKLREVHDDQVPVRHQEVQDDQDADSSEEDEHPNAVEKITMVALRMKLLKAATFPSTFE